MQLKNNTEVFTSDNQKVGEIDRVVIDPRTKEITHVVIRKGMIFHEDKVVPIDLVAHTDDDRIVLRNDTIESLPRFEERRFINPEDEDLPDNYAADDATPLFWYPFGSGMTYQPYIFHPEPPYIVETEQNIPERTVAVKEGAKVISADGTHVGDIERVFVNPDTDRIMTFLVSNGLLLKEKMFVPSAWVSRFEEDEVHLVVNAKLLEKQSKLLDSWEELTELAERLS